MKKINHHLKRLMAIALPLILLCSCYEIVYVSQDGDKLPNDILRPDICIQVYNLTDKPVTPYIGFLAHKSWNVKNGFVYTRDYNGNTIALGKVYFNKNLSIKMEQIEPTPQGYYWWVGTGDTQVGMDGVFHAYPIIKVGNQSGKFTLDYMVGDSKNGLNVQRSDNHDLVIVKETAPSYLRASRDDNTIQLKWKAPMYSKGLYGYHVYRDDVLINDHLIQGTIYTDNAVPAGSHAYSIVPVYKGFTHGTRSIPANICYSPCGTSMDFDGVNDKLVIFDSPSLKLEKALTLEAWIKTGYMETANPRIISKGEKGIGYELLLSQIKGYYSAEFRLPNGILKSTTPLLGNVWYHVAAVYDGKAMVLYINGKKDCSRHAVGPLPNSGLPLVIGKSCIEDANFFAGDIDDVRIWNVPRTEAQIFENFSSRVPSTAKGLVGNWTMSEGCSIITCDNSENGNDAILSGSCFCGEVYPFIPDVNNQSNNALVIPVMNVGVNKNLKPPKLINLEFKINPKLLKFEGVITENTQLDGYAIKLQALADGNIRIIAQHITGAPIASEVLLYVDVKPLVGSLKTDLKFNTCTVDGQSRRVSSGEIVSTALPAAFKTGAEDNLQADQYMKVYPNPATTTLNIEVGELEGPAHLRVVNLSGQEVYSNTLEPNNSNTTHRIDLLGFSKGIYLINLQLNNKVHVKKIAVN